MITNNVVSVDLLKKVTLTPKQCSHFKDNAVQYYFEFEGKTIVHHINLKTGRILIDTITNTL